MAVPTPTVSVYTSATDTSGRFSANLDTIVSRICGSPDLARLTETARQLAHGDDPEAYREFKATKLPAATFAGTFRKGERKASGLDTHSGLVVLDYDHLDDVAAAYLAVAADRHTVIAFISPSGDGLKVVVAVDPVPTNADEHLSAWETAVGYYDGLLGAEADPSGKDLPRLTFLAYDPDALLNRDATLMIWAVGAPVPVAGTADQLPSTPLNDIEAALATIPPDYNYDTWRDVLMALHDAEARGLIGDGLNLAIKWSAGGPKFKPGQVEEKWRSFTAGKGVTLGSLFDLAKQFGFQRPRRQGVRQPPVEQREPDAEGTQRTLYGDTVLDRLDAKGLATALNELGILLRLNARARRRELLFPDSETWEPENDEMMMDLKFRIAREFRVFAGDERVKPADFPKEKFYDCLLALAHRRRVDPFIEWLEELPPWDGLSMVPGWLNIMGSEMSELNQVALKRMLIGAVRRAYEPAAPHDFMPVLVGPQWGGKSLSVEYLFPAQHREDWFTDCAAFRNSIKENVETIAGSVICEFSELIGLRRAEIEGVKAFISRKHDRVRAAYARTMDPNPRRWVAIGTANDKGSGVLPDDTTGNRRFVVIPSNPVPAVVVEWMDANRELLWAEALDAYRRHEPNWLPRELRDALAEQNAPYTAVNEGIAGIAAQLTDDADCYAEGRTVVELLYHGGVVEKVGEAASLRWKADQMALAEQLKAHGWVQQRVRRNGNARVRLWFPPEVGPAGPEVGPAE